jgi:preprotein translocase subunit YajC
VDAAGQLIFLALLIGIFYFMLIRPQRRRVEGHRRLMASLDVGDEVVTIGGIHGRIVRLEDDDAELEVAPGTTLRILKSAIARVTSEEAEEAEGSEEPEDAGEEHA